MFTEFFKNSIVVSSDFSVMKNIVASCSSSLPIELICCFKSRCSNSICLLKVYTALKKIYDPINCQLYNHYFYSFL